MNSKLTTAARNARRQTAVIEYHVKAGGPEWWALLPNGEIQVLDTASEALREVQRAARRGNRGVTVTTIEWRNCPEGFRPPSN